MAGYTYSNLTDDIRNWTEVDSTVFTQAVINRFIENAEYRLSYDVPIDADRVSSDAQLATDYNSINVPAGCLFVRAVEVFDSTSDRTGKGQFLLKRDQTFIQEYVGELTGPKEVKQVKILRDYLNIMPCLEGQQQLEPRLQALFI